jgi:hypothetical protein
MVARSITRSSNAVPPFDPDDCVGGNRHAIEPHERGRTRVEAPLALRDDAGRARRDEEERHAVGVAILAGRARRDHEPIGDVPVEDLDLLTRECEAAAGPLCPRRHVGQLVTAPRLLVRERRQPLARDQRGQMVVLLRVASAEQQRGRREQHAADERLGQEAAPRLLHHDRKVAPPEPRAAVLLGDDDAEPAELGHGGPELAREPERVVAELAHATERRAAVHELARGAREDLLLLGPDERHRRSVGEAKHLLGDDVQLDLRGAALDRVAARTQPVALGVWRLMSRTSGSSRPCSGPT